MYLKILLKPACVLSFFALTVFACELKNESNVTSNHTEKDSVNQLSVPITLVIHGGAGYMQKENLGAEKEQAFKMKLEEALESGYAVLENGGSSLEAVSATLQILEESPLFNAGRGAVFANNGKNELDASIMDGKTGNAGAITGVTTIKSPILAAKAVLDHSDHVMLAREGAEAFAAEQGLEIVDPSYFYNESSHNRLIELKKKQSAYLEKYPDEKFGTVGCIALDKNGNIAAGTSTGGMSNKKYGRIGDTPIIGAGTYADNLTCGVSSTGHGEYFMRSVVAYDIAARMKYLNESLEEAANEVVMKQLVEKGGNGGVVALDRHGNIAMPFNTTSMLRGYINEKGKPKVAIFKDIKL